MTRKTIEKKKKIAAGTVMPTAKKRILNNTTNIPYSVEKIKCVIQMPGQISEAVDINNTLESFQEIVGGYIETLTLLNGLILVMNEEGKLKCLEPNIEFYNDCIVGPVLITKADYNGDFCSLTVQEIQTARAWLIKNAI